jgi:hypothetical protein
VPTTKRPSAPLPPPGRTFLGRAGQGRALCAEGHRRYRSLSRTSQGHHRQPLHRPRRGTRTAFVPVPPGEEGPSTSALGTWTIRPGAGAPAEPRRPSSGPKLPSGANRRPKPSPTRPQEPRKAPGRHKTLGQNGRSAPFESQYLGEAVTSASSDKPRPSNVASNLNALLTSGHI